MILNALSEVLFWNDLSTLYNFTIENERKYYPHSPDEYFKEKRNFYIKQIGTKENFFERIQYYKEQGKPIWTGGNNQNCDDLSLADVNKAIYNATEENGYKRMEKYLLNKSTWASHLNYYANQVNHSDSLTVLELSVGAGLGTCSVLENLPNNSTFVGVDIDYRCAKTVDGIAIHLNKNACGIAANFWNMPFENNMFDVICCHGGIGECREINTILSEVVRILKPKGHFVICERTSGYSWQKDEFDLFEISENETINLLKNARLFSNYKIFKVLCSEVGLVEQNYAEFPSQRFVSSFVK